jgi:DNA-binding response OmpR family regulator
MSRRILIADDNAAILGLLTVITRRSGFEPDTARDGIEAIRKIEANDYSVIFLDLMMPRLDGYDVIDYLRRSGKHPAVIVATAMNTYPPLDSDIVHLMLRKPFDVDMVGALIAEAASTIHPARGTARDSTGPKPAEDRPA